MPKNSKPVKPIVFTTIEKPIPGNVHLLDYPGYMPLPRIGEFVSFQYERLEISGRVKDVRHIISAAVSEVKIVLED